MNITLDDQVREVDRREAIYLGLAFLILSFLAGSLSLSMAARLGSWESIGDRWDHWMLLPIWLLFSILTRSIVRRQNPLRDPLLLPIPLLFIGWGILTIWRLDPTFGIRQTGWFALAFSGLYFFMRYWHDLTWIRRYRYLWITFGLLLMGLTLVLGTHPGGGSPRLWLGCCGFYFQPSEALRFILVAYLAAFLADRLPYTGGPQSAWTLGTWLPLLLIWLLSLGLLVAQRDLGTAMLFLGLLAMMLYLVLQRWQVAVVAIVVGLLAAWLGYQLFDVVRLRIDAWIFPFADPLGGSYQIVQSLIAVAAGGVFGRGMGLGSPGFVPAIHTDFIFTAIVEEHGLLAGLAIIALWAIWLSRIFSSILRQRNPFATLLQAGLVLSLGLQTVLIIGGNLRVFPLVGITLPFTSYGGSSLLVSTFSLGIFLLLSSNKEPHHRFQLPLRHLHIGMLITMVCVGLSIGWWNLVESTELLERGDNPRTAIDSQYSLRGSIVDRNGAILARTSGSPGAYARTYPEPSAAPIVGYDVFPYGRTGIEEALDGILRGNEAPDPMATGWHYLTRGLSPDGRDVRLTLNVEIQQLAMELLSGSRGAIVLVDADRGDLLVAASSPSFNANELDADWQDLLEDPASPLLNRAIQGRYQPGMAIAPFLLAYSVDNDALQLESSVEDLAQPVILDGETLSCVSLPMTTDPTDYKHVLLHACPNPMLSITQDLDFEGYTRLIDAFGFNQDLYAIGLESVGRFPVEGTIQRLEKAVIGQSSLTVSPLHMARAMGVLISDGILPTLRSVDAVRVLGEEWSQYQEPVDPAEVLTPDTVQQFRDVLVSGDVTRYQAQALGGEPLGWFLGGIRQITGNFALAVVLEGESPQKATEIGLAVLDSVSSQEIP